MESKERGTQEPLLSITGPVLSGKTGMVVSLQVLEYEKVFTGGVLSTYLGSRPCSKDETTLQDQYFSISPRMRHLLCHP